MFPAEILLINALMGARRQIRMTRSMRQHNPEPIKPKPFAVDSMVKSTKAMAGRSHRGTLRKLPAGTIFRVVGYNAFDQLIASTELYPGLNVQVHAKPDVFEKFEQP